jgi:hypothetical protein
MPDPAPVDNPWAGRVGGKLPARHLVAEPGRHHDSEHAWSDMRADDGTYLTDQQAMQSGHPVAEPVGQGRGAVRAGQVMHRKIHLQIICCLNS